MPRTAKAIRDSSLLAAALEGLELQKRRIDDQIQEVRLLLGKGTGRRGRPPGSGGSQANCGCSETPLGGISQVGGQSGVVPIETLNNFIHRTFSH
jgi:hypothetical protein